MPARLTDTLCTRCGLCCDGTFLADVELDGPGEATRMEALGLEIEEDDAEGERMPLPCRALRGTRCSVYAHRPACCRTFECRLLQEVRRGTLEVERALTTISDARARAGRVRALLAVLGQRGGRLPLLERCAEAISGDARPAAVAGRARAELRQEVASLRSLIARSFL